MAGFGSDHLTENFYLWESRGRGWMVFPYPVDLEPRFVPFQHAIASRFDIQDDGLHTTFLGRVFGQKKAEPQLPEAPPPPEGPLAYPYQPSGQMHELALIPPSGQVITPDLAQFLLAGLSASSDLISFEVIGTSQKVHIQLACSSSDLYHVRSQCQAYFPETILKDQSGFLYDQWHSGYPTIPVDFALEHEFMRPLPLIKGLHTDLLAGVVASLDNIQDGELGMLQILFKGVGNNWSEHIMRSVTDRQGRPFFVNAPEMVPLAKQKVSSPLFATVIRLFGQARNMDRARHIAWQVKQSLGPLLGPNTNALLPVLDPDYPIAIHLEDFVRRQSRRAGMLLNQEELVSLVHIPSQAVASPRLSRLAAKTKAAPTISYGHSYTLGINEHNARSTEVGLSLEQRLRHVHLIGATGTGKSTLMLRLMKQDMEAGHGFTLLDPHGDLVDAVIAHLPAHRLSDVILIDPSDSDYVIGLNLLSAKTELEKIVLSSDLVAMFRRLASSWGDTMEVILANSIDAMLEYPEGATLLDLRRFLVEKEFREAFLQKISDPNVRYYWEHEYPLLRSNSIASLLTRLNTFLRPKVIRSMMAIRQGVDLGWCMNSGKILLVKLSQGIIGVGNSYLLGTLIVAKLQQAAQARQIVDHSKRTPYFLYIDEFQNFITPSLSTILSGARKYGLGMILAHQDLQQLFQTDRELGNAVISNPGTRVCFRVGDFDAQKLASGYSYFDQTDLQSLTIGQAIVRIGGAQNDCNLQTALVPRIEEEVAASKMAAVIAHSRSTYGTHQHNIQFQFPAKKKPLPAQKTPEPKKKIPPVTPQPLPVEQTKPQVPAKEEPQPKEQPSLPALPPKPAPEPIPEPSYPVPEPLPRVDDFQDQVEAFKQDEQKRQEHKLHQKLQRKLKQFGQEQGFFVEIEKETPDTKGRVDVSMIREDITLAFEVCITTSAEHELGNITKCLKAGYDKVISIAATKKRLISIQKVVRNGLSPSEIAKVHFLLPDEVPDFLLSFGILEPKPKEQTIKGYRVKVNYQPEPDQGKRASIAEIIRRAIARKKNDGT